MIQPEALEALIRADFPDASVEITDKNGMRDHYIIRVASGKFEGVSIMDRHRLVMAALQPAFNDGRLHAAEIQTTPPDSAGH